VSDPFATAQQVAALLGAGGSATLLARAGEAVQVVSATMRAYMRQTISLVEDDTVTLAGTRGRKLIIPERPVIAVTTVTLDGTTIETDDYRWTRAGALWRDARWDGPDVEIEITYDHGYATVPDDLVQVCRTATARLLANTEGHKRFEVSNELVEVFDGPWGFTLAELLVLNRYRRRVWP
jgi:hypothetical protein